MKLVIFVGEFIQLSSDAAAVLSNLHSWKYQYLFMILMQTGMQMYRDFCVRPCQNMSLFCMT